MDSKSFFEDLMTKLWSMKAFLKEAMSQVGASISLHMMPFTKVKWKREKQMGSDCSTLTKASGLKVNLKMTNEMGQELCFKMDF